MKKVVKPKNLLAFRIWLESIGYKIKQLENGFTASGKGTPKSLAYALVFSDGSGNSAAWKLGQEFEIHLTAPEQPTRNILSLVCGDIYNTMNQQIVIQLKTIGIVGMEGK